MATSDNSKWESPVAYSRTVFIDELPKAFAKDPRYIPDTLQGSIKFLEMIEKCREITDIRWAAYMIATTMWETTTPRTVERAALNKKGAPIVSKKTGEVVTVKSTKWQMAMEPADEVGHGKGRRYYEPVKIKILPDDTTQVTEHDGDQFTVGLGGKITKLNKAAKEGAVAGVAASPVYEKDDGTEHVYYGRGYVQLTWWSNYVRAGVALGIGVGLLVDPDLVKTPEVAFKIMALGMLTGQIYANGHKFSDYISGAKCDYKGARKMVNGNDHAADIEALAKKLEGILLKAKAPAALSVPTSL